MPAEPKAGLLRSPPFPGIATEIAGIDAGPGSDNSDAHARTAAEGMVAGRVGGSFWGRRVPGRPRLLVLDRDGAPSPGDLTNTVMVRTTDNRPRNTLWSSASVLDGDIDPWPLIETAEVVIAPPGSEIRILAVAAGKRVIDLAGTHDDKDWSLFARALFDRRYRDPITGKLIGVDEAIALLASWRTLIDANRGIAAATGMSFWKRREVARLLWDGRAGALPFLRPDAAIARARREGGAVAAWPARVPADFADRAAAAGVPVRWVEDGFLRSAGLGSDLLPPLSLIVDDLWPYFDPARASRLEVILENGGFEEALLDRARSLRETIVGRRIGKYHVGGGDKSLDVPDEARLVLVVGQVEDDLSMLLGGASITNLTLLERARTAEPDAYIVYRPHPDVEAGHRKGAIPDSDTLRYADHVDRGGSLDALLARADTLHTITSLTGFEALMRGVRVVTHGNPWYAGWGLTEDHGPPLPRRTRRLTLDELVAGALILYPRYLDARTGLPCTPEQFIEGLGGVGVHAGWLVWLRRWQGRLMRWLGVR